MDDVAGEGRTVIFVSHHMSMIQALCKRGIVLDKGQVAFDGTVEAAIGDYMRRMEASTAIPLDENPGRKGNGKVRVTGIAARGEEGEVREHFVAGEPMAIEIGLERNAPVSHVKVGFTIINDVGVMCSHLNTEMHRFELNWEEDEGVLVCQIPRLPLPEGNYRISVIVTADTEQADKIPSCFGFTVVSSVFFPNPRAVQKQYSPVMIEHGWEQRSTASEIGTAAEELQVR
jgi:lipopolysaccharide transport system ATP-binding protein